MEIATCLVGLTYEGVNKILSCDILFKEGADPMLVFEWFPREKWGQAVKLGLQVSPLEIEPTDSIYPEYHKTNILDLDLVPQGVRGFLLKAHFGHS